MWPQSQDCLNIQILARKNRTLRHLIRIILRSAEHRSVATHRQVIYLNDKELDAVQEYCVRFGIKERSTLFREAAMARILAWLSYLKTMGQICNEFIK